MSILEDEPFDIDTYQLELDNFYRGIDEAFAHTFKIDDDTKKGGVNDLYSSSSSSSSDDTSLSEAEFDTDEPNTTYPDEKNLAEGGGIETLYE